MPSAKNQSLFREVNERIGQLAADFGTPASQWVCECAHADCFEQITIAIAEYETVRAQPDTFVVAPGDDHVLPEVERVTRRTNDYWVVQKVDLRSEIARERDRS